MGNNKMRVTRHIGKIGKNGPYSPKHNDRQYDYVNDNHIKPNKTADNWYWHRYIKNYPDMSFDDCERKFYEDTYICHLREQNDRYIKDGHRNRCKSVDDYRKGKNTAPDEIIYYIGSVGNTVDADTLKKIVIEQINWETKTFSNVAILNVALHVDESGAPHIHMRQAYVAHDKDGYPESSMTGAMREMQIDRPDITKAKGKYNNAKMSYTKMCRDHFANLCRQYGLQIEMQPQPAKKSGKTLDDYKADKQKEVIKKNKEIINKQMQTISDNNSKIDMQNAILQDYRVKYKKLADDNKKLAEDNKKLQDDMREMTLRQAREIISRRNASLTALQDGLQDDLDDLQDNYSR